MKKHQKQQLPEELFTNSKIGKRGKAELTKSLNVRLAPGDYKNVKDLIKKLGCSQSNLLRYLVKTGLTDLNHKIKEVEKEV